MGFSGRLKRVQMEAPIQFRVLDPRPTPTTHDIYCYLWNINRALAGEPGKYDEFVAIMRAFKYGSMNTDGVVAWVEVLLAGHPELLREFNKFLTWDYIRSHGPAGGRI
ncbi:unnamed protein product [Urochloa humidicola]